ncbi:type IV secretion system protein VirB2 [Nitrosomonas eutropha]|uniref:Type IV secretion system protein VirB2 n=1 Tax=Nitrosomonas eutropha TaxID=916 RepID=A0A1I7FBP7_9PROT|nr:TrbC/VirB2 family protein [Nitrosomonas eutropha]SFU33618.1 type IV secretion system protein VirB2 [Nitrosomonas eutropha]
MKSVRSLAISMALVSSPAFAQLERGTTMLNSVSTWLLSIGVVVLTIALMFVGFRMMFQAAQWKDVAPVFWGGVLIGGAAGIAGMLIG